jgi:hypothetical protein
MEAMLYLSDQIRKIDDGTDLIFNPRWLGPDCFPGGVMRIRNQVCTSF